MPDYGATANCLRSNSYCAAFAHEANGEDYDAGFDDCKNSDQGHSHCFLHYIIAAPKRSALPHDKLHREPDYRERQKAPNNSHLPPSFPKIGILVL